MQIWHRNTAQSRRLDTEPMGIIDIGSNSVRLVVYDGAVRAPVPLFNEKVLCGLGRDVGTSGKLPDDAVERTLQALGRFRAIANVLGVKSLKIIATAAVRDAKNGKKFLQAGEKAAKCAIEVLSGEREASLAAQGIMMGFVDPDGVAGDLGGGSLELIDIKGQDLKDGATLALGSLRLIDVSGGRIDKSVAVVDRAIKNLSWVKNGRNRNFYAVGGTWRSLAKMHMEAINYPLRVMHGYKIKTEDAIAFSETIRRSKKWLDLPGASAVARARRESFPYGALVLERLLLAMEPKDVVFSVFGIREGYIHSVLSEAERHRDPLLSFCETLAAGNSRSVQHARELWTWTTPLFEMDADPESAEESRQRHAACLLSDIGWRGHPDYRGEQSMAKVAHASFTGVDHDGRVFLALSLFYRHETNEDRPDPLFQNLKTLVSKRGQRRARLLGSAIRVAHMLSIGQAGVIDETSLRVDGQSLILTIPSHYANLDGERLRRRFDTLAQLVGKKPVVVIDG